jgi:hypothetical protein
MFSYKFRSFSLFINIYTNMFHSIVVFIISLTIVTSANLNGIYVIDSCDCDSPSEKCELNGPFIFDQQRSSVAVRYGSVQVGVGTLGNNRLDLYLNQNRCKGLWNGKSRLVELNCKHQGGVMCTTKLRCVAGTCLDEKSNNVLSSSAMTGTFSVVIIISSLFMLIY